jgi:F0F1-type ATP synthase delta subunit
MTSRSQVASYVADHLVAGRRESVRAAAAWLIAHGKRRQVKYLVRDVAQILADQGYVVCDIITARPLTSGGQADIERYIKHMLDATKLEVDRRVDVSVIGGALIELPDAELDGTIKTKLAKFVEGVSR